MANNSTIIGSEAGDSKFDRRRTTGHAYSLCEGLLDTRQVRAGFIYEKRYNLIWINIKLWNYLQEQAD